MAAGDRNKNGKPSDIVRHYGTEINPHKNYPIAICGNKHAGYVSDDINDITCLNCINKLSPAEKKKDVTLKKLNSQLANLEKKREKSSDTFTKIRLFRKIERVKALIQKATV